MSEGPSTFDPRYDVRYQRGYTAPPGEPVEQAATDASPAAHREPAPLATEPRGATRGSPGLEAAAVESEPADASVTRVTAARRSAAPAAAPPAAGSRPAAAPAAAATVAHGTATARDPRGPLEAGSASSTRAIATRWLWLVFGAGVAFVLAGTAMYWSVVSRQNPFESGAGARDTTVDQIVVSLSPAVVQAGVLGMIGALLAWALLGARGADPDRTRP